TLLNRRVGRFRLALRTTTRFGVTDVRGPRAASRGRATRPRRCAMKTRCLLLGAMLGLTSLSAGADDWPQFRGTGRDNRVTGFAAPATWPAELKKQWKVTVGDGVASPALVGDKLYVFTRQ